MPDSALPPHLQGKTHWDWPTFFTIRWRGKKIKIGFAWVPRGWTAFSWGTPSLEAGNQARIRLDKKSGQPGPGPIGEHGSWQISEFPDAPWWLPMPWLAAFYCAVWAPGLWKLLAAAAVPFCPYYMALTTRGGRHFRIGPRWDDVDGYVEWPSIATRKFPSEGERDTSTL